MTYVPITEGTLNWDVPLNAALADQDERITANESRQSNAWIDVKADYGAVGDGVADDTAAIQQALTACNALQGGTVYLPRGEYKITAALQMFDHVRLLGDGDFVTEIHQVTNNQHGLIGDTLIYVNIESLRLTGTGSGNGSGQGIKFTTEFDYCLMRDVTVTDWGSTGIEIEQPIVTNFTRVTSRLNGASGFYIHGTGLGAGTSLSLDSCWAHDNVAHGYNFLNMTYCALVACASDNQINGSTAGYLIDTCTGFSMIGCGSEGNNIGIKFNGGTTHFVGGFFCYATIATGIGIYVTAGCTNVQLIAIAEVLPDPAASNWVLTSSGTSATIQGSVNSTANGLAANTTVIAANASGIRSYPNGVTTPSLTMTGPIAMGNNKITGQANGTVATDSAAFGQIPVAGTTAGTFAAGNDTRITGAAQKASNLSDLANAGTARTNLGLGGAAVLNVGTTAGTVMAGNDTRLNIGGSGQYSSATESTTLATQVASTNLVAAVEANATYLLRFNAFVSQASSSFIHSWTGPAGATMNWADNSGSVMSTIGATDTWTAIASRTITLTGKLITSSTAGNLTFTYASGTAGQTVTVNPGAQISLERIA